MGTRRLTSSSRLRLSALYALSYGALGAITPYLALELRQAGAPGWALVLALSASPLARLLAGPLWAALADRLRVEGRIMALGAALATGGAALLAVGPALAVPGAVIMALGRAPFDTTLDGLTVAELGGDPAAYGRVRLWGSLGFLGGALVGGGLEGLDAYGPIRLGALLTGLTLVLALVGARGARYAPVPVLPALRALWGDRRVPWFVLGAALHFLSHAGATTFLAVHLRAHGAPTWVTGLAIAVGVGVETCVMASSKAIFTRFSTGGVLLFATLLALPRWLLNAALTGPVEVVLLQSLHGITFGAFWVAAVSWIASRARPEIRTSAQALLGAAVAGVGALGGNAIGARLLEITSSDRLFLWMALASLLASLAMARAVRPDPQGRDR